MLGLERNGWEGGGMGFCAEYLSILWHLACLLVLSLLSLSPFFVLWSFVGRSSSVSGSDL